jgi:predicted transcriptional regulator
MTIVRLAGLEESFDNEAAEKFLNLSVGRMTTTADLIRKSVYDFDLDTPSGIAKLLSLLPIMDPEIIKDIIVEIWPGYPTDVDARRHKMEIRGYLKDYLESYDEQEAKADKGEREAPSSSRSDAAASSEESGT